MPAKSRETTSLLRPGQNCWKSVGSPRVGFCVDAATYFSVLESAARRAEHSILMVGWDIHSRLVLRRSVDGGGEPFSEFLTGLVRARPDLNVHILGWDFALIYALERESLPALRFGLHSHRRVHFALDGNHPMGSSHHQKAVVIDDAIAFVGGIDLTTRRWDTREHHAYDPRRVTPNGDAYGPFHDVQAAVEGPAAAAVGELLRERWRRATGDSLSVPPPGGDRWPSDLPAPLRDARVGIARTEPAWEGREEVREIERAHLDVIASARQSLYIENQYFTSPTICQALADRLSEANGPDVVMIVPERCTGWLEEATMGTLRRRALSRLRRADRGGRLRVLHPVVGTRPRVPVNVHAKLMIVDDRLVRVGSGNLNNRSMGTDTECDLLVEVDPRDEEAGVVAGFRAGLLAEHVGAGVERVANLVRELGLAPAVDRLREESGKGRSLVEVREEWDEIADSLTPDTSVLDPERPVDPRTWVQSFDVDASTTRPWLRVLLVAVPIVAVALLWQLGPLRAWLDAERLESWFAPYRQSAMAGPVAILTFVLGGLVVFPVTLLIVVAALAFGPLWGFVYSLAGVLASAAVGYGIGRVLWRDAVRAIAGRRLNRLSRNLAKRGILATVAVRVVPIAPFTVVNLVAGSSHLEFRSFLLGTFIGMAPGIAGMTILADSLLAAARDPDPANLAIAGVVALIVLGVAVWWSRRLGPR